jgi:hypothetical protein
LSRCFRASPYKCVGISFLSHASYLSCSTHPPAGNIFKWRKKQRGIKITITESCQYLSDQRSKSSGFRTMLGIVTEYFHLSVRSNRLCYRSRDVTNSNNSCHFVGVTSPV